MHKRQQWAHDEFCRMVERNGFFYSRNNGSHAIYVNDKGRHISIPLKIPWFIAARLIKENNLETDRKKVKKDV